MSSPEKARDLRARGSATRPLEACVLGVGVVVTEGVNGGSRERESNDLPVAAPGAVPRGPSREWRGGRMRV